MTRLSTIAVLAILLALSPRAVAAQSAAEAGGATWGAVEIHARGPARVPLAVSGEGRSHALAGAGIGFVVGAGATLAVLYSGGSTSLCNRSANQDAMAARECVGLAALGGLAGAGLGAVIGAQLRTRRGRSFALEGRPVALAPLVGRGVGLTLSVAF